MSDRKGPVGSQFGSPKSSRRLGIVTVGYLWAVTVSAQSFMVICAFLFLRNAGGEVLVVALSLASAVIAAILFWIVALVTTVLPASVTYAIARRFGFRNVVYCLSCGAMMGLLLGPVLRWFAETMEVAIFLDARGWISPMLMAIGAIGGITFWFKAVSSFGASGVSRAAQTLRRAVDTGLGLVVFSTFSLGLFLIVILWPFLWLAWSPESCITETKQKISNLSGFDFESTITDCDAIAKWVYVRVLASHVGKGEKTLLFEYNPNVDEIPEISVIDSTHVAITIPLVSSIQFQMRDWGDVHIEYRIGRVIYEGPS